MGTTNVLKQRLTEPDQFAITIEYTVPDVGDEFAKDVESLSKFVGEDDRITALSLTDRVPSTTTHDTVDLACRAANISGKTPLVHISGKNRNLDNFLEQIQRLVDNELENALIITGDKARTDLPDPTVLSPEGFLDSVQGIDFARKRFPDLFLTAAVSSFKYSRAAQTMQYMKMEKKIAHGCQAIFNQVGFDMRKVHELATYVKANNISVPLVHALYWPTAMLAKLAIEDELPGVVATDEMHKFLKGLSSEPDKGKGRRMKIVALQIALCRAWGFGGVHVGGMKNVANLKALLDLADELYRTQSGDDLWQQWQETWKDADGKTVSTAPPNGYYFYQGDGKGLNTEYPSSVQTPSRATLHYKFMHKVHDTFFEDRIQEGRFFWKIYNWADRHPWIAKTLYYFERACKYPLVQCQGCGSCSLPETAYVCTESACAKKLPNGPCGGSKVKKDECEVREGIECAWVKVYRHAHSAGVLGEVAQNFVPTKYVGNKGTCSWITMACKRDHRGIADAADQPDADAKS